MHDDYSLQLHSVLIQIFLSKLLQILLHNSIKAQLTFSMLNCDMQSRSKARSDLQQMQLVQVLASFLPCHCNLLFA